MMEPMRQEWSQVQATAERFKIEADQLEREAQEAGSMSRLAAGGRSVSAIRANEASGKRREAVAVLRSFHSTLCQTRVLDPACGTGNFLYVALALMKQLEGEVLEAISDLAGPQERPHLARQPDRGPASVPRARAEPARRSNRGAGHLARLSAMAFPHER